MFDLEYFDSINDAQRLRSLQYKMERAERQQLSMQNALSEHPVTWFVKNLPVESPMYPAIEYLTLAKQMGTTVVDAYNRIEASVPDQEGNYHLRDVFGREFVFRKQYHDFIEWQMPAHDLERPKLRHCGFIRSKSGNGVVYTACPEDADHHIKAKRLHCWGLGCPECMNDTAIRDGVKVDKHFRYHETIWKKSGQEVPPLGHWVVSPPQEWAKCMVQDKEHFDILYRHITDSLQEFGAVGGITIFHPWRQYEQLEWRFSPHFHSLLYGFIDTTGFRKANPGWVIKKIHADQGVQSIRHSIAYLSTHQGLGIHARDPADVDWDLDILDHLIPGLKSKGATYNEKDYENLSAGRGRMAGDLSDMDWEQWTMDRLGGDIRCRYWGALSKGKLKTLGKDKKYMYRRCKECGALLRTYDGSHDHVGEPVRYINHVEVKVPAPQFALVKSEYNRLKDQMKEEDMDIIAFAKQIPCAVSTLELDLPRNDDLEADGPFDRPDEYYLKRQRKAFGPSDSPIDEKTEPHDEA
ncbi:MAG: hypothetical protein IKP04_05400 [Candidatus Methanomethylophilaceae archaeon]|nr:hypothetical protein [Candidatus Methanomethylophilaceae archaeon]